MFIRSEGFIAGAGAATNFAAGTGFGTGFTDGRGDEPADEVNVEDRLPLVGQVRVQHVCCVSCPWHV